MVGTFREEEEKNKISKSHLVTSAHPNSQLNTSVGCCSGVLKPLGPPLRLPEYTPHLPSANRASLPGLRFSEWNLHLFQRMIYELPFPSPIQSSSSCISKIPFLLPIPSSSALDRKFSHFTIEDFNSLLICPWSLLSFSDCHTAAWLICLTRKPVRSLPCWKSFSVPH